MTDSSPSGTTAGQVQRVYLTLTLLTTLATSFIWGVNTLFLLDAGLNNTEAFAANAFFSVGMVLFEVPTGVVADVFGGKAKGCRELSLIVSTGIIQLYALGKILALYGNTHVAAVKRNVGHSAV